MDDINWNDVANKIRAKNFNAISDYAWNQIADKVEPKKKGRRLKPVLEYREDWSLEDLHETERQYAAIIAKYDHLRLSNVKSKKAFELIADNLDATGNPDSNGPKVGMTAGNVERIVYAWIKMGKELNKMMQEELCLEKMG